MYQPPLLAPAHDRHASRSCRMLNRRLAFVPLVAFGTACADSPVAPRVQQLEQPALQKSEGRGVFQRYVALGTSITMGVQSDGVFFATQEASWPAQLARLGGREITLPLIQLPGCHAPIAAPLAGAVRISKEPALADPATLSCAPNVPGVTLPTQNVAINGARAFDALHSTPENILDLGNKPRSEERR